MSNENGNAVVAWDQTKIDLLKRTVAKGATNDEFAMFQALAEKYDLDPYAKEIWCIVYEPRSGGNRSVIIQTSRDGYLKICQRDPDFLGVVSMVVRENDEFSIDAINGTVLHKFGSPRGKILGAWAVAKHRRRDPAVAWAEFSEYNSSSNSIWQKYPSAMICKVAEVMVLKRQGGISGLVTREEMGTQEENEPIDADFRPTPPALSAQASETRNSVSKANGTNGSASTPAAVGPSPEMKELFLDLCAELSLTTGAERKQYFGALGLTDLRTDEDYSKAIDLLQAHKDRLGDLAANGETVDLLTGEIVPAEDGRSAQAIAAMRG